MASRLARIRARTPTYLQYTREHPAWLSMLVFGRLVAFRRLERLIKGARIRPIRYGGGTRLRPSGTESPLRALQREGVATGVSLTDEDVTEIRQFAATNSCSTRGPDPVDFLPHEIDNVNQFRSRDILAAYYFEKVEDCRTIVAIRDDPLILAIAASYIGQTACCIRTRLWWSFPGERVDDADLHAVAQNKYHFDMNDWRTLKFFFYLTDTDADSGAHSYIAGSHVDRSLRHQLTLMVGHEEDELRRYYGADRMKMVIGPAGLGFIEDPFVFHTGNRCRTKPRLLLEIEYAPRPHSESYKYGILG